MMEVRTTSQHVTALPASYPVALRAIGSDLEARQIGNFELSCEGTNYLVQAKSDEKKPLKKGILTLLFSNQDRTTGNLIYTPEQIKALNCSGQQRREGGGMLDPHSLPQSLRAIGAYINFKGAHLVRISKRGANTTVEYDTAEGGHIREEFTPTTLYELFVRMYVRRTERAKTEKRDPYG
jgi:hypothetical protein